MRLIVLAAGQGFKMDGFSKALIHDPNTGETLLEKYKRLFKDYKITVVTGHNAVAVMSAHPDFDYVHNEQWRTAGNSYTLALALDNEPTVVMSGDLLFGEDMVELIEKAPDNAAIVINTENKGLNTVRCKVENNTIKEMYLGEQYNHDPEVLGIFKITDTQVLRQWKQHCLTNKNVFAGLNLPLDITQITAVEKGNVNCFDINTPIDYLHAIKQMRKQ